MIRGEGNHDAASSHIDTLTKKYAINFAPYRHAKLDGGTRVVSESGAKALQAIGIDAKAGDVWYTFTYDDQDTREEEAHDVTGQAAINPETGEITSCMYFEAR